jgi:hypothetical protein
MKKAVTFFTIAVLSAILFFGACSKSTKPAKTQGADNDPNYQLAQNVRRGICRFAFGFRC